MSVEEELLDRCANRATRALNGHNLRQERFVDMDEREELRNNYCHMILADIDAI